MLSNKRVKAPGFGRYLKIVILLAALIVLTYGCAHTPQVKASPLPKFLETELGRIAVVPACFEPEFKCPHKPPTKLQATSGGALSGFLGSIGGGVMTANPIGMALGVALSPVAAAGGAFYGAIGGETKNAIKDTEKILNNHLNALRAQEVMWEKVLPLAGRSPKYIYHTGRMQSEPNVLDDEVLSTHTFILRPL